MSDREIAYRALGDKSENFDGSEKRVEFPGAAEVVQIILQRLDEAKLGNKLSDFEADAIKRYFMRQLRRDRSQDTEENRRAIDLLDQKPEEIVDSTLPSPFVVEALPTSESSVYNKYKPIFEELESLAISEELPQGSKDFLVTRLRETLEKLVT